MKCVIKTNTKKEEVTFPCLRVGIYTGKLYLCRDESSPGVGLEAGWADFKNTDPWTGTVTITQD